MLNKNSSIFENFEKSKFSTILIFWKSKKTFFFQHFVSNIFFDQKINTFFGGIFFKSISWFRRIVLKRFQTDSSSLKVGKRVLMFFYHRKIIEKTGFSWFWVCFVELWSPKPNHVSKSRSIDFHEYWTKKLCSKKNSKIYRWSYREKSDMSKNTTLT